MTDYKEKSLSFDFGFGNIEHYLKSDENSQTASRYFFGANGTYSLKITDNELFIKNFGSNPGNKKIYKKTVQIIRKNGKEALNAYIDENSNIKSLISEKRDFEKIYFEIISNNKDLSDMGLSVSEFHIQDLCFREDEDESVIILENKKKTNSALFIAIGVLTAVIITILIVVSLPKKPSGLPVESGTVDTQTETVTDSANETTIPSGYAVGDTIEDMTTRATYIVNEDGTLTFSRYNGNFKEYTVPSSYKDFKVTKIGCAAFAHNTTTINNLYISEGICGLEDSAFIFSKINHISIPSTLTDLNMWQSPFRFNKFLDFTVSPDNSFLKVDETGKYLLSKDGTELYSYACGNIDESPVLPDGIIVIHNQAFAESPIKRFIIPEGVETINFSAFLECNSLEYVYVPSSVISLPGSAFSCTRGLKEIEVSKENNYYYSENGILYEIDKYTSDIFLLHIPCTLTSREYKLPECKYIASGLMPGNEKIVVLVIPEGTKRIFSQPFISCVNLKVVYIPASVEYLADNAFEYDYQTEFPKTIYGLYGSEAETAAADKWRYAFAAIDIQDNEMHIKQIFPNGQNSVNIPESIDGYKIVIDEHAFDGISSDIIIYGESNGYVQEFAQANGYKFKLETKGNN